MSLHLGYVSYVSNSKVLLKLLRKKMRGHSTEFPPCDRHLFMLSHQKDQKISPRVLQTSFCLPHSQKHSRYATEGSDCGRLNCPTFNNDRNCATPAFVTTLQKSDYGEAIDKILMDHDDFPISSSLEKSELFQPKPNSKKKYCHVCKIAYKEYRVHIHSKMHKESIRKSPFNQHILDLADKYHKKQRVHREARRKDKLEMVAKTADQESNQAVFIDREGKMEKRDESLTVAPAFIHFNRQIHRDIAHPFHIMSYQHEQQCLAYHTAFYQNLFFNSTRNMTNYSFSPSVIDYSSTTQGKDKKSLTYIIIDE